VNRHVELISSVSTSKYVFTIKPYPALPSGKIGFNTLQVRAYFWSHFCWSEYYFCSVDGLVLNLIDRIKFDLMHSIKVVNQ